MTQPLQREALMPRINGIKKNLQRMGQLGKMSFQEFKKDDNFDLAQHHLRLALEAIFHIGGHILSRLPGGRAVEYVEIAAKLGEFNIVPKKFADEKMVPMAKMRNILVHHYINIDARMLYEITKDHLDDIEKFLQAIKKVMEHPAKFGLQIE